MTEPVDDVAAGRAAWERIKGHDRKSWDDWLMVGRAIIIGRAEMMAKANSNRPLGTVYNRLMGEWLKQHGFGDVNNQERYRVILCIENATEIEVWRAGLDEGRRRRLNHPGAVWHAWRRRKQDSSRSAPACRNFVKGKLSHQGKAIYWPQACIRRAHEAMLKSRSSDLLVLARAALEAAVPTEDVLIELIGEAKSPHQPKSAVVGAVHAA